MKKLFKNKRIFYVLCAVLLLVLITGCTKITDKDGVILPEKIITLDKTFKDVMGSEGWFQAIIVWPLAEVINYATPHITVLGAIALVTIAINVLTFGLTVKSTVSSQKMQMIQPELQKIQEKYKERKDQNSQLAMGQEMQALYAKHNVNPFGSLLTAFMQFPIIIGMYQAVQRAEAVVTGEFMGSKLINSPMFGFQNKQWVLVIIFVLMAITQFASMQLPLYLAKKRAAKKKKRPGESDNTANQSSMMMGMIVLILFLAINWPAAMSLYWIVTSVVNIVKTYFIQWRYIDNEKV